MAERLVSAGEVVSWRRTVGARGQDVVEIHTGLGNCVRVAKVDDGHYSAVGLGGWSLAVFSRLGDVVDALAAFPVRKGGIRRHENVLGAA